VVDEVDDDVPELLLVGVEGLALPLLLVEEL